MVGRERLRLLTETSHFVDELLNVAPDPDQAYVGRNAFAHKGGMHVAGVQADARTFEHLDPELVGNSRDVLISELSGKGSVLSRAERAGIELDADAAKRAVERVKEREHRGYHYEAADASFELMLRRESGQYSSLFRLESFRVITEKRADGQVETEATIKIWVEGRRYVRTAEGNGPVNALDRALRAAITDLHPHLADIELTDYKVRILDSHDGTGAVTRVLLDSSDGHDSWGSIGVSENIIEASWEALVDSLEYAFQPGTSSACRRPDEIPLARPDLGAREEELVLEVLRSGRLSLGPVQERFEHELRRMARRRRRRRGLVGHGGAPPGRAAARLGRGRRGRHLAVQLRRVGQLPPVRGRGAGLRRRRSGHAEPRPGRGGSGGRGARRPGSCRSTSSATRRRCRSSRSWRTRRGLGVLEDSCEALGAVDADGRSRRRARQPRDVRVLREQAAHDRRGRHDRPALGRRGRDAAQRAEPGPRRGHGLARPRPPRASTTG